MASQCLQLHALRTLLTGGSSSSRRRSKVAGSVLQQNGSGRSSLPHIDGWQTRESGDDLREAARFFRDECEAAVRMMCVGSESSSVLQADAACTLVERLLVGICDHLPEVRTQFEVKVSHLDLNKPPPVAEQEVVVLEVRFHTEKVLAGEIATRSRVTLCVQLKEQLRFALALPRCDTSEVQPLLLLADGLDLPVLPDCAQALKLMRAELGAGMSPITAYEWWEQHRHARFPLRRSKFHRLVESLFEQKAIQMVGKAVRADTLWGYIHTSPIKVQAFLFRIDRRLKAGVSVSVRLRPAESEREEADRKQVKAIIQKMMKQQRSKAEKFAPSGINVGAMLTGVEAGQPGACPRVLAKLFTAAKWKGYGKGNSWHKFDQTWNCTDRKDLIGRVLEENGRLIWRLQDGEVNTGDDFVQAEESNGHLDLIQSPERSWNLVYVTMFLLLLAVATAWNNGSVLRWLER